MVVIYVARYETSNKGLETAIPYHGHPNIDAQQATFTLCLDRWTAHITSGQARQVTVETRVATPFTSTLVHGRQATR